jgi:hypothetical protein
MADPQPLPSWKKIALHSFFGGIGIGLALTIAFGVAVWRHNRPARWSSQALTASYESLELSLLRGQEDYGTDFVYNVKNNTNETYKVYLSELKTMAVLVDGKALSMQFGPRQDGGAEIFSPPLIPPGGTARVTVRVKFRYPEDFADADKESGAKLTPVLNEVLEQLSSIAILDEANHYRIDLPSGWGAAGHTKSAQKP